MKDDLQNSKVGLAHRLEKIEELIENKEYVTALAQIREVQSSARIDSPLADLPFEKTGLFCYLSAKVFHYLSSYQEAQESGQKALSIFIELHDELGIAQTQYLIGLVYIATGELKSAESEVRDALTGFRRVRYLKGIIDCLSQLSHIEFIKGNYSKSVEYIQDALTYAEKGMEPKKRAFLYGNLGRMLLMMGNWREAEKNLLLNIELNRQAENEFDLCRSLLSLGYVHFLKRKFKKAKESYDESLSFIQKHNCVRELTIYHEYSGELTFAQGDYQSAENHYKKVFEIMEEKAPESDMISQTNRLLAELQMAKKEYDLALSSCEKALKVSISLGEKLEESACYRILGQIYTVRGDKEKARDNFNKSLSILEEIQAKYELARTCLEAGKSNSFEYFERLKYLGMAKDIFSGFESAEKNLESKYHLALINKALAQLFYENKEYEQAGLLLKDAEKGFKDLKEKKDLELIQEFKKKIGRYSGEIEVANPEQKYTFSQIITQNREMLGILEKARRIKDTDMTILIEGETGTGKDLLAKCIHYESKRKHKKFIPVSCAAIPESLLESELFGHKKGAFTSAGYDKKGLLEEADGGTLFLNEVVDLPWQIQAKLLGVIENKELTRLGETEPRRVDFRIIAASNRDLKEEVKSRRFRDDLYYRLKIMTFVLPPLKKRKEDIPLLLRYFIETYFEDEDVELGKEVVEAFIHYDWPGNVRELENEIRKYTSISELIDGLNKWDKIEIEANSGRLMETEKAEILHAVKITRDKKEAAKLLGISLSTLYRKIKFYELSS